MTGKLPAFGLTTFSMELLSCLSVLLFGLRLRQIRRFTRQRLSQADESSITFIHRISKCALMTAVFLIMTEAGNALVIHLINGRHNGNLVHLLWFLLISMNAFNITFPAFYIMMLRLVTEESLKCLSCMTMQVREGIATADQLMSQRDRLATGKADLERLFNHIPAILFTVPFITIPEMIVTISSLIASGQSVSVLVDLLYYVCMNGTHVTVLILLIRHVTDCQDRERVACQQLIRMIQSKYSSKLFNGGYQAVIEELRLLTDTKMTGCSLFVIEWPILLSTISALVSVGVLVIQIAYLSSQ